MQGVLFTQNEKADTIRRIPRTSSTQFSFPAYTHLNMHSPRLPRYFTYYVSIYAMHLTSKKISKHTHISVWQYLFLKSLRHFLLSVSFQIFGFGLLSFCSYVSGLACVVVLSYPVLWYFTFALHLNLRSFSIAWSSSVSRQSVTSESVSL